MNKLMQPNIIVWNFLNFAAMKRTLKLPDEMPIKASSEPYKIAT